MIKNILITGLPGCGKTTLIKEIIKVINFEKVGFFTEEIREKGERVGFK
ncbi:MAG: AAA family ATPase, partial [bacterium]|nr:AAA family ATPase [bacterium]MDW8163720.1 nucleoside-triphosphatase [Candidatus Omnitrophota bacterium]